MFLTSHMAGDVIPFCACDRAAFPFARQAEIVGRLAAYVGIAEMVKQVLWITVDVLTSLPLALERLSTCYCRRCHPAMQRRRTERLRVSKLSAFISMYRQWSAMIVLLPCCRVVLVLDVVDRPKADL